MIWVLSLLLAVGDFAYRPALPGYHYQFPRDHFEHSQFRTEWWYYTGNVRDAAGKRFGFELVFFRQGADKRDPADKSAWRVDDVYLAHLALTDIDGKRFYYTERLNRAGPGIAGASFEKRRIWNGNWSAQWDSQKQTLEAIADDFRFTLHLSPETPPVIHGENGVSQKAEGLGRASHYVSIPRLGADGRIALLGANHEVSGAAWMDHEWFTQQLDASQAGWDWFSVQLEDHTELMLFELRRKDGGIAGNNDPYSSGTWIDRDGRARHLRRDDFTLQPMEFWVSPKSQARYPIKWRIQVPSLKINLDCEAAIPNQELSSKQATYWEGAVTYSGSAKGVGYLEMTGYDKPVRLD
ncbi:MAG: carotenoid 1,2-hydratase [Acidobacteriota bacterium]|nr:carotenoid 1,2-hydratase [Acidobacteriota bacterium]